ncbi:MAG: sulfite exporter TauE/SafE family protein [Ginsengibacter sp.]
MDNFILLLGIGFIVGTLGTLIGAGGGFILVPLLIIMEPGFSPETITAISMAIVACNAISGSVAYVASRRVDFKAGLLFAFFTIPGSILGVLTTKYISREIFDVVFGLVLVALAIFLFVKGGQKESISKPLENRKGWVHQRLVDKWNEVYNYSYDIRKGSILSIFVGYFSPLLGIGGGIIHVPAMVEWLRFPVHIATATSHFILAIMATVSVIVHIYNGNYNDPVIFRMVLWLAVGVVAGAQMGAFLSRKMKGKIIIQALAVSLGLVGVRILMLRLTNT